MLVLGTCIKCLNNFNKWTFFKENQTALLHFMFWAELGQCTWKTGVAIGFLGACLPGRSLFSCVSTADVGGDRSSSVSQAVVASGTNSPSNLLWLQPRNQKVCSSARQAAPWVEQEGAGRRQMDPLEGRGSCRNGEGMGCGVAALLGGLLCVAAVLCFLALSEESYVQAAVSAQDDLDVTSEDYFFFSVEFLDNWVNRVMKKCALGGSVLL